MQSQIPHLHQVFGVVIGAFIIAVLPCVFSNETDIFPPQVFCKVRFSGLYEFYKFFICSFIAVMSISSRHFITPSNAATP